MSLVPEMVAAATGVVALMVTWHQVRQGNKERRVGHMPYLSYTREITVSPPEVRLTVTNKGNGPAVIAAYGVDYRGVHYKLISIESRLKLIKTLGFQSCEIEVGDLSAGEALGVGENALVFSVKGIKTKPSIDESQALREICAVNVDIEYRCLYGTLYRRKSHGDAIS